jgi:hypothetical protein
MATALTSVLGDSQRRDRLSRGALAVAREMSLDAHATVLERVFLAAANKVTSANRVPAVQR